MSCFLYSDFLTNNLTLDANNGFLDFDFPSVGVLDVEEMHGDVTDSVKIWMGHKYLRFDYA